MVFNSYPFLLLFPFVTIIYFLLPHRFRWVILLIASCLFYMAFIPKYILILFFLIIIDYIMGIKIENTTGEKRKTYLLVSILSTVAVLLLFKYFNFFNENFSVIAHFFHLNYSIPMLTLILPIGLSFHTFQSLSYVIEVYKRKQPAERHFGIYALYVMFYPQLVAGPIERPQHLLPQLHAYHAWSEANAEEGLKRMVVGFFKKVVIADRLSVLVNQIYVIPSNYTGIPLIIATIAFAFQIYCDFSGYSDIAIGAARVMGYRLTENFKFPYFASSIPEFWRRWHISLYSWFRDYVYIPLGGNRGSRFLEYRNIFITFLLSGFWHGAAWTYIAWGSVHGLYIIVHRHLESHSVLISKLMKQKFLIKWRSIVGIFCTFFLICIGWVFFRARSLTDAIYILSHAFVGIDKFIGALMRHDTVLMNRLLIQQNRGLGISPSDLGIAIACLVILLLFEWLSARMIIEKMPSVFRYFMYIFFVLAILNLQVSDRTPFVYFQF